MLLLKSRICDASINTYANIVLKSLIVLGIDHLSLWEKVSKSLKVEEVSIVSGVHSRLSKSYCYNTAIGYYIQPLFKIPISDKYNVPVGDLLKCLVSCFSGLPFYVTRARIT